MSRKSLLGLSACLLLACGNTGTPAQDYGPLLDNLGEQVILPEHRAFVSQSDALVVALQALSDNPNADSLLAAQAAWRAARAAFRNLDALHFGPELTLHISERIDVWPADFAGIETWVSGTDPVDDYGVSVAGGKKKGFLGLEYLLFPDPTASSSVAPALVDDDAAARRRALSISIADEIKSSAQALDMAWEPGPQPQGGYVTQVEQAGTGGTIYATQRAAVEDLAGGVGSALELIVGTRLAKPLGRASGVLAPELDATPRSDNAVADMQASLSGALALYSGTGFSAVIRAKSADLDQLVQNEFAAAQAKLGAIPAPFADALVNHTDVVKDAYTSTQALKQTWNTEVSSFLGATVKVSDADGD